MGVEIKMPFFIMPAWGYTGNNSSENAKKISLLDFVGRQ